MQPLPPANHVNDPKTSSPPDPQSGEGFRISDEPVVRSDRIPASENGALPASYDADVLYVIARDPKSLFVYWDLNWTRLFARAVISPRQVHLRIYREDGSIEGTREINPFRGHCYADVAAAGTGYYCELGCFEDDKWTSLLRSRKAATPDDRMSEDLSAQFATLPLHLSFQRMLDILRATQSNGPTLARSVAELQESASAIPSSATSEGSTEDAPLSDVAALLQAARAAQPTAEDLAQWRKLGEEFGGSSWGGASGSGFGASSSA
jgi:hypothetical protein